MQASISNPTVAGAPNTWLQMAWQATPDIGKTVAAVIAGGPAKFAGKHVGVNAQTASLAEVADTFSRVFGKKVGVTMGRGRRGGGRQSQDSTVARSCCTVCTACLVFKDQSALHVGPLNPASAPPACAQVVAVTPPADDWAAMLIGYGTPEAMAKDMANM